MQLRLIANDGKSWKSNWAPWGESHGAEDFMEAEEAQAIYEQMNEDERNEVNKWMACHESLTFEQAVEIVVGRET
jgi:hypothetical protein